MSRIEEQFSIINGDTFNELYEYFRVAASHVAPEILEDEEWSRDVFFHQVLSIFGESINSWEDVEFKFFGKGRTFDTLRDFKNWLYTCFKNGLLSELQSKYARLRKITGSVFVEGCEDDDEYELPIIDTSASPERDPKYEAAAEEIFSKLSWEIHRILSFRYLGGQTYTEIAGYIKISKSNVEYKYKNAEKYLRERAIEILGSPSEVEINLVKAIVIRKAKEWSDSNE